jgi:hypothetical protein
LVGNYTINTAWHFSDDGHGGTIVSDPPVSATSENTLVQSTSAHDLIVSSAFTEALSSDVDRSAFLFRTNLDHHTITDPVNFAQNDKNRLLQQPADNLPHLPAQLADNGPLSQWASFKFAYDGSAHPGATLTAPSSDLSGNQSEIDHTMLADIQHLLDTARDAHAVSTLDPNHAIALEHMTTVQLPHHQGDFHFA